MTRADALDVVRRLTVGLDPGDEGRFLERVAVVDEDGMLKALLLEAGARALLQETRT